MSRTSRNRRRRQKRKLNREKFHRQMSDLVVRLASFAIETAGKEAGPFPGNGENNCRLDLEKSRAMTV